MPIRSVMFNAAANLIIAEEGGLSLDRRDRGNWTSGEIGLGELRGTKFGISAMRYPKLDIANLAREQALDLYFVDYWSPLKLDSVPWCWALAVFDCAVNQGEGIAPRMWQDALGVMVDGRIGPRTIAATQAEASVDSRRWARFMCARAKRYMRSRTFDIHGDGWLTRTYLIARHAQQPPEGARSL